MYHLLHQCIIQCRYYMTDTFILPVYKHDSTKLQTLRFKLYQCCTMCEEVDNLT